ncbi:MAG: fused MFS/spermidine synthase, partial [Bacilli bacterium]|nr:fused MFS/spermidine synthase [Bacilli bacterium]
MKKKWFLYLTGFFCGMSVMAIEIGAQRLLAPYFSSSQIVWTIVIGVIMISMAIGNVLGGKMADKHKDPKRLFIFLFLAAIWTALIPLVGKFVISGIALLLALFVTNGYLIWAATISCLVVFVFPLLILGMVTPNLVKFTVTDEKESGKTVGVIEALNTIGSILGTFLPTFGFIPFIGTALTFIIFASILFIICLIFVILTLIQKKKDMNGIKPSEEDKKQDIKKIVKTTCLSLAALSSLSSGFVSRKISSAYWQNNVIYESESIYNYIRVEETSSSIILSTNVLFGVQSIMMKDPEDFSGMYFEYALTSPYLVDKDEPLDICILGLCTGTFASKCYQFFPNCNIDGVEIDGKIVDVAYKYFNLSSKVNVYINDGRSFIDHTDKKYDVIMVDAYKDVTIPFQMSSDEFFKSCASHLKEGGNMVCNF